MRAMILAAGRGERLRPLTDTCPKPLIPVHGQSLLHRHIARLKAAGITDIVINSAWLSSRIVEALGDGSALGVRITHSVEEEGGLETAGGIIRALPQLGDAPFFIVNGDTLLDADYARLAGADLGSDKALLYLVPNPPHHPSGDFAIDAQGYLIAGHDYTFSGAALYRPEAFAGLPDGRRPLKPLFEQWMAERAVRAVAISDPWFDIGTTERLAIAEAWAAAHDPTED